MLARRLRRCPNIKSALFTVSSLPGFQPGCFFCSQRRRYLPPSTPWRQVIYTPYRQVIWWPQLTDSRQWAVLLLIRLYVKHPIHAGCWWCFTLWILWKASASLASNRWWQTRGEDHCSPSYLAGDGGRNTSGTSQKRWVYITPSRFTQRWHYLGPSCDTLTKHCSSIALMYFVIDFVLAPYQPTILITRWFIVK